MSALLQRRRRGHTVTGVMALDAALMAPPPLPLTVQSTKSCGLEADLEPEQIDNLFKDALWRADAKGNVSCFTLNNVSDTVRSRPGSSWLGRISVQKEVAVMAGREPPAVYVYFRAHATEPTVTIAMTEDDPPWSVSLNDAATEFLVGSEQGEGKEVEGEEEEEGGGRLGGGFASVLQRNFLYITPPQGCPRHERSRKFSDERMCAVCVWCVCS